MNMLRAMSAFALFSAAIAHGQLMHVTVEGTLTLEHHPFPEFPITDVSGPHAFRIDAVYDASLPSSVNVDDPGSRLFFPESGFLPHGLRLKFDDVNWFVPLREIEQRVEGDFGLAYFDRFSSIRPVIHFGAGAIADIDQLITPTFFDSLSGEIISGELNGFLIGIGGIDGVINAVDAEWFTPVPESKSYACASALLIVGLVLWRKRRTAEYSNAVG